MENIVEKLGSYNIINNLLPGAFFVMLSNWFNIITIPASGIKPRCCSAWLMIWVQYAAHVNICGCLIQADGVLSGLLRNRRGANSYAATKGEKEEEIAI